VARGEVARYDANVAKKGADKKGDSAERTPRVQNRRARFDFHIVEKVECGIRLQGTEVKSLRAGNATLAGAYARISEGEVFLCGANIALWPQATGVLQHDPFRDRKLLLHRRQIAKLETHAAQKGHTLVPLALYFKSGWAKCELGIAIGKRTHDKREALQKREHQREMDRASRPR